MKIYSWEHRCAIAVTKLLRSLPGIRNDDVVLVAGVGADAYCLEAAVAVETTKSCSSANASRRLLNVKIRRLKAFRRALSARIRHRSCH